MRATRFLSYAAILLAFGQIVFGAIVRITGSGLGCGDHWPKCLGRWFPPLDRIDLIIEITHRYIAAGLSAMIVALALVAWRQRGRSDAAMAVSRTLLLAAGLVVVAALLGAVTVKLDLHGHVVVTHLAVAMALLATLVVAAVHAGGFGAAAADTHAAPSLRTVRGSVVAVALAFIVLVFGALTANTPGAPMACQGFPLCTGTLATSEMPQHIHLTHRVLAFLLGLHVLGLSIGIIRRNEAAVARAATYAFIAILAQIMVAWVLVTNDLPPVVRSMHQAFGTLVWLFLVILAVLARNAARRNAPARDTAAELSLPHSIGSVTA